MSCAPSSLCGVVILIYVGRPGYAKCLAGLEALLALAMHGCRARLHHRTQRCHHRKWHCCCHLRQMVQMCQLPCRFGRPCLSGHCPSSSLLLPLLRWRTCHCCAGVTASIALMFLPSTCWRHCPSCTRFCPIAMLLTTRCHCRAGIFAGAVLVSLPALRWHLCRRCAGIVALIMQASLPALCWCLHSPRAGTIAFVELASLP
jgi:hypothetical protein